MQVGFMGEIYEKARRVVAWIGEADSEGESERAIAFLKEIGKRKTSVKMEKGIERAMAFYNQEKIWRWEKSVEKEMLKTGVGGGVGGVGGYWDASSETSSDSEDNRVALQAHTNHSIGDAYAGPREQANFDSQLRGEGKFWSGGSRDEQTQDWERKRVAKRNENESAWEDITSWY